MEFIKKHRSILGVALVLLLTFAILVAAYFNTTPQQNFMEYNAFLEALHTGQVERVNIGDTPTITFTLTYDDTLHTTNNPRNTGFIEYLLLQGVEINEASPAGDGLLQMGFTIALVAGVLLFLHKKRTAATAKNGIDTTPVNTQGVTCSFDSVAGNLEAKENVQDIIAYLKDPAKFAQYGARMPRGILFHGKPGTGKTLMAKAMAGEAGVPFYAVSGSDFVQMYVGVGAARVRELFKKARDGGKGVIFIDEIDALGKKRSGGLNGNDEREQTLNALLTEMQGFNGEHGIVVVAATNRPDTLDDALLRPGRFDRRVEIGLPDLNARKQIIGLHAKGKPICPQVDLNKLATDTVYFSGAMLEGLLNDAAINAARRASSHIETPDITSAYYTALVGSEKKDRSNIQQKEREITAWHEAGHAMASILTNPENRVAKVTIIPSTSGAGGFCVNIPPERMYYTKQDLQNQIIVLLAGRAAEEMKFGKDYVTTGASNDIEKATHIAMEYIGKFGMGGSIADLVMLKEDAKAAKEAGKLLETLYDQALVLLQNNQEKVKTLAEKLLAEETVDGDAIVAIAA